MRAHVLRENSSRLPSISLVVADPLVGLVRKAYFRGKVEGGFDHYPDNFGWLHKSQARTIVPPKSMLARPSHSFLKFHLVVMVYLNTIKSIIGWTMDVCRGGG